VVAVAPTSVTVDVGPATPTVLSSPSRTNTTISLRWTNNQIAPAASSFEVWSSLNGTTWTLAGTAPGTASTTVIFTNVGLTPNTTYYYQVRAVQQSTVRTTTYYYSGFSNTINRTTLP